MVSLQVVDTADSFELPPMTKEQGSSFGWADRMFFGWRDGKVFDYGDWAARDLSEMMTRDYKARQIENVQAMPILSAERSMEAVKNDRGEYEWLEAFWDADPLGDGCETDLDTIIDQMTTAFHYRKAFWEIEWGIGGPGDFAGKVIYNKIEWRPQTTCRLMRDPRSGKMMGFEQEAYYTGFGIRDRFYPLQVPAKRAFVYLHGERRDPINGTSDMEIPYWAWKTKQKILFLWFQFLEGVALPRTIVKGPEADKIARGAARVKNSGVLPIETQGAPSSVEIDTLDLSGKGAEQFIEAIKWLDQCATNSVLAGFLDLTQNATTGGAVGVHLSKDASDFYLQTLEAKSREMAKVIRRDLFAPLVRYNFGPRAAIPKFKFEPLNAEDKSDAVAMLTTLLGSRDPALVPDDFVGQLAAQVADYMGMDGTKVEASFVKAAKDAKAAAAKASAQMASQMGQQVAGTAGAVRKAGQLVAQRGRGATIPGINGPQLPRAY